VLEAPIVQLSGMGTLAANGGGGGGNIADASGVYNGQPGQLSAASAWGSGTTQFSAEGGNGGAGDNAAGVATIAISCGSMEGLGGGGAAGRITINSQSGAPTVNAKAVVSPSKASGAAVYGTADVH
jgi:hypothetical protein